MATILDPMKNAGAASHLQPQRLEHTTVPDVVRFDREHTAGYDPGHDLIQPAAEHVGYVEAGADQDLRRPHEKQSSGIGALPEPGLPAP